MTQPDESYCGPVRREYILLTPEADRLLRDFQPADPFGVECPRCGAHPAERCMMLIGIRTDHQGTRVEYFDPSRSVGFHRERKWLVRGK